MIDFKMPNLALVKDVRTADKHIRDLKATVDMVIHITIHLSISMTKHLLFVHIGGS